MSKETQSAQETRRICAQAALPYVFSAQIANAGDSMIRAASMKIIWESLETFAKTLESDREEAEFLVMDALETMHDKPQLMTAEQCMLVYARLLTVIGHIVGNMK